jgi:hypothetical protein
MFSIKTYMVGESWLLSHKYRIFSFSAVAVLNVRRVMTTENECVRR